MRRCLSAALLASWLAAPVSAQPALEIALKQGSPREAQTREQLQRLVKTYDVSRWIFTKSIVVDERAIPHSHPVLTLHARHLLDDDLLLSTLVHEQFHWFLVEKESETKEAIAELRPLFATVPVSQPEGAQDEHSTYLHLLDCYLEYRAVQQLLGELKARQVMEFWATDHYTWVYRTVLDRSRDIGAVMAKHKLLTPLDRR
ncbi:MAG TPA: hypothetical protein VKE51_04780 [Vicinamibacterales bacterium]|nr:hypothetical protein [Vicinamibacterales bacterium]